LQQSLLLWTKTRKSAAETTETSENNIDHTRLPQLIIVLQSVKNCANGSIIGHSKNISAHTKTWNSSKVYNTANPAFNVHNQSTID